MVIIALAVLLLSALVVMRSSNVAMAVAGNIAYRSAADQAAEVAINNAVVAIQGAINPDTGAGFSGGVYFPQMQSVDAAGIPTTIAWASVPVTVIPSAPFQTQWAIDRLCSLPPPVTDPVSQCQTSRGPPQGNSIAAGAVQFVGQPRVFYRITVLVSGPKSTRSYVQALVEL